MNASDDLKGSIGANIHNNKVSIISPIEMNCSKEARSNGAMSDSESGFTIKSRGYADPDYLANKHQRMWCLMDTYIGHDKESI